MARPRGLSKRCGAVALAAALASADACLDGCASPPPSAPRPAVSYDFSALLPAPFGTSLKDMPVPLTEVLVFHEGSDSRAGDDRDCFRPNLRIEFLGHPPSDYLACFDHDRLKRIEASVALPEAQAAAVFAAACAEWQGGARAQAFAAEACEGRRAEIDFSARLTSGAAPEAATISITLIGTPGP